MPTSRVIDAKYEGLQGKLRDLGRVVVAYSGGVDSTLLLRVARDVLGRENVLAVTARSATTARHEAQDAASMTGELGVEHLVIESQELNEDAFAQNPYDRCYVCKKLRFSGLSTLAEERGFRAVVDGENADDVSDYRPGSRATKELGVKSPLREAGLTKAEIRKLSRRLGLRTWDKPAYACLATRIPYNTPITVEKLMQVDAAEEFIRDLLPGVQVRVRHHGDTALIEVPPKSLVKLIKNEHRSRVIERLRDLGFTFVALDLEGYTTGKLNLAMGSGGES